MSWYDVIFEQEPDFTIITLDGTDNKHYTGLKYCQEEDLENPAGILYKKIWHALVDDDQYQDIMNNWPANKRPKNPRAADNKYFRPGSGPGNWKAFYAYGPGRDTMTDYEDVNPPPP